MKQCVYQVFQFIWHYWMMYKECYAGRQCVQPVWLPTHLHKVRLSDAEKKTSQERLQCHQHAIGTGDRAGIRMNALYYVSVSPSEISVIHSWSNYQKAVLNATWTVFGLLGDALPLKLWDSRCQVESIWCRASANKWRHPREKTHRAYSQVWMPTYIPTSQKGEV